MTSDLTGVHSNGVTGHEAQDRRVPDIQGVEVTVLLAKEGEGNNGQNTNLRIA